VERAVALNRGWWEERAAIHGSDGDFYDCEGFLDGDLAISDREVSELELAAGTLRGRSLVHLQCHIGLTTLSLARLGAHVTGIDFSATALRRARRLADHARLEATFVECDVHRLPRQLFGLFDIAFASFGVLVWAYDLAAWMASVAGALRPGGALVLVDGHPIMTMVQSSSPPTLRWAYQSGVEVRTSQAGDYAVPEAVTRSNEAVLHLHGLGDVVTAATRAGLIVEALTEWTGTRDGHQSGKLIREADGMFRMPFAGAYLPIEYALRARRPAS
jgi:SAM-dependent methyltransferase